MGCGVGGLVRVHLSAPIPTRQGLSRGTTLGQLNGCDGRHTKAVSPAEFRETQGQKVRIQTDIFDSVWSEFLTHPGSCCGNVCLY
jgi:hypothetical protein